MGALRGDQGWGAAAVAFALPCSPPGQAGEGHAATPPAKPFPAPQHMAAGRMGGEQRGIGIKAFNVQSCSLQGAPCPPRQRAGEGALAEAAPKSAWKTCPRPVLWRTRSKGLLAGERVVEPFSKGPCHHCSLPGCLQPPPAGSTDLNTSILVTGIYVIPLHTSLVGP